MNWLKSLNQDKIFNSIRGKVRLLEPLKKHTTFKIGGPAKIFIEPEDLRDLKLSLNLVKRYKIPFFLLGRGSNILIDDHGLNAVVLRLNAPYFKRISLKNNRLKISSGVLLNKLVLFVRDHGLSGAEFLAGIPGTVGGALAMNAGITEKVNPGQMLRLSKQGKVEPSETRSISDLVEDVTVMDYGGNIKTLNKKNITFNYRWSSLSKFIIISTSIKLIKGDKKQIRDKINTYLRYRRLAQDLSRPSAGCVFKNPLGYSAGRLIDLCGLKGRRAGDACISQRHANFILNLGQANAKDVLKLMDLIKRRVKDKFLLRLEPEIKIWQ